MSSCHMKLNKYEWTCFSRFEGKKYKCFDTNNTTCRFLPNLEHYTVPHHTCYDAYSTCVANTGNTKIQWNSRRKFLERAQKDVVYARVIQPIVKLYRCTVENLFHSRISIVLWAFDFNSDVYSNNNRIKYSEFKSMNWRDNFSETASFLYIPSFLL